VRSGVFKRDGENGRARTEQGECRNSLMSVVEFEDRKRPPPGGRPAKAGRYKYSAALR